MKKIKQKGFTLVELLIVIALIAILSVAVLATINPIEQTNKARDAKFRNDAAEVLSALERYYASMSSYPWMNVDTGTTLSIDDSIVVSSSEAGFGVLGSGSTSSTGNYGLLITTSELKSSFAGKEPFVAGAKEEDKMYIYHNGTTNSNYVCYHPKAAANRVLVNSTSTSLKCLDVAAKVLYDYGTSGSNTCEVPATWDASGVSSTNANLICVPEGTVQ